MLISANISKYQQISANLEETGITQDTPTVRAQQHFKEQLVDIAEAFQHEGPAAAPATTLQSMTQKGVRPQPGQGSDSCDKANRFSLQSPGQYHAEQVH
jgi:hypothetical protein